jgi:O-antigen ligase
MATKSSWESTLILLGAFLVTVVILPNWSYDPVSSPKQYLLTLTAGIALASYILRGFTLRDQIKSTFSAAIVVFLLILSINILLNNNVITERLFGIRGRSTGFVTFFSLAVIALVVSQRAEIKRFFIALLISSLFVSGYFILQINGLDIFTVEEFYSTPSSTLGNPNFVSGFVGFSLFSSIYFINRNNLKTSIAAISVLGLNVFVLLRVVSIQGTIALIVGFSVFIILHIFALKKKLTTVAISTVVLVSLMTVLLGLFGRGPLSNFLESSTTFSRLDYWRAAMRMLFDHPIFGVGLDGYRDNYRIYRDEIAIERFGAGQVADSAHNIFLDLFAAGGFPLGSTFLFLVILPAFLVLRKVVRASQRESLGILLLAIWSAYQVQALSSVYSLGVGIWGWILLGVMVSYALEAEGNVVSLKVKKRSKFSLSVTSATFVFLTGSLVSVPQLAAEARILKLANQGDGLALTQLVTSWPQDSSRINLVAQGWQNASETTRAKGLILKGLELNPDYYPHWDFLFNLPNATPLEKSLALSALKRLDPFESLKDNQGDLSK